MLDCGGFLRKRVFSVGRSIPGDVAEFIPFKSDRSLFDGDVILFFPTLSDYDRSETYAGQTLVANYASPALARDVAHWRSELSAAVESGKVVFVFLARPDEVYHYTGTQAFSGTGRGRVTTNHVQLMSSYEALPVTLANLTPRGGKEIAVMGELGPMAAYWAEFGPQSEYEVYFDPAKLTPLLGTKKREKAVGAVVRTAAGGALVLVPPVVWDERALIYYRGDSSFWKKEGVALGNRLVAALINASDAFRKAGKRSPTPEWVARPEFVLAREKSVQAAIADLDLEQGKLAAARRSLLEDLEDVRILQDLLFEAGEPLEHAILHALRLLGFEAAGYKEGGSEFDAVFVAAEGRFLGEAEGKESKAVNIDKMSQLERNLQEDFAREDVTEYAKGVLFGNAFRFTPVAERSDYFTKKCVSAAERLHSALVRTPDLFIAARYLSEHDDRNYATACRQALFAADGTVVAFPEPPAE